MPNITTKITTITASDAHNMHLYQCVPKIINKEAIIVLYEIFGLTDFIKDICRRWATLGYYTVAPALYDRLTTNSIFSYSETGLQQALRHKQQLLELHNVTGQSSWELPILDIQATIDYLNKLGFLQCFVIGYSWGGTLAWRSAARFSSITKACAYYGSHIFDFINEAPKCPMLLHTANKDDLLTLKQVNRITKMYPDIHTYKYQATHGFCCPDWKKNNSVHQSYNAESALLAQIRTERFIAGELV